MQRHPDEEQMTEETEHITIDNEIIVNQVLEKLKKQEQTNSMLKLQSQDQTTQVQSIQHQEPMSMQMAAMAQLTKDMTEVKQNY